MIEMRWLLVGAGGWIGQQVLEILQKDHEVISNQQHFGNRASYEVRQLLDETNPDRVFVCLGRAYLPDHRRPAGFVAGGISGTIDDLEHPTALAINIQDNLYLPILFAEECKKRNIHCTYMGTGCIYEYDGVHIEGFTEEDEPNYVGSSYSVVKSYTDRLMKELYHDSCLTLRIRMPIVGDLNPRNFITKILKYEKIVSIPNSMSVLPELLPIAVELAIKKETGLLNLTNHGLMSHREVLETVARHWGIQLKCEFISGDLSHLRARRSNNFLNTNRLRQLAPQTRSLEESLEWLLSSVPKPPEEQLRLLGYLKPEERQEGESVSSSS